LRTIGDIVDVELIRHKSSRSGFDTAIRKFGFAVGIHCFLNLCFLLKSLIRPPPPPPPNTSSGQNLKNGGRSRIETIIVMITGAIHLPQHTHAFCYRNVPVSANGENTLSVFVASSHAAYLHSNLSSPRIPISYNLSDD
jgi:hypothetical protein